MENEKIKIVVTSAGRSAGLNFCRCLRKSDIEYEIIGLEGNKYSYFQMEADKKYYVPEYETEVEFIEFLKKVIKETNATFLYPSKSDKELLIISKYRKELNIKTFLPPHEMIEFYENKFLTYEFFKKEGLKVPYTQIINNENDLKKLFKKLGNVWLRCTHGSGGKGSLPTKNYDLAKAWIEEFKGWGHFTGAEVLTPRTATWSGLWNEGKLIVSQVRERIYWEFGYLNLSGVTGITGAQMTKKDEFIDQLAERIIKNSNNKPHGIISIDFTYDKNGIPNPTEIQASRYYTSTFFMASLGLNFPDLLIKTALGIKLPNFLTKYSPLEEGWIWIKFIDCLPKLVHKKDMDKLKKMKEK